MASPPQQARCVPVLMYHDIADGGAADKMRPFVVPPGLFEEHLHALAEAGYRTAQFRELGEPGQGPPDHTVYLTFDDGYVSYGEVVAPLFSRFGMTGTVFVPTAFVDGRSEWLRPLGEDNRRIMSWSQLRDVVAAGSEVGGHGHWHLQFDLARGDQLVTEIVRGREILQDELVAAVDSLAYPFGYHCRAARRMAVAAGYTVACEVGLGMHRLAPERRYAVRRLLVGPQTTADDLLGMLASPPRTVPAELARSAAKPAWRAVRRFQQRQESSPR